MSIRVWSPIKSECVSVIKDKKIRSSKQNLKNNNNKEMNKHINNTLMIQINIIVLLHLILNK